MNPQRNPSNRDEYNLTVESYTIPELYTLFNLNNYDSIEIINDKFRIVQNESDEAGHPEVFLSFLRKCQSTIIESIVKLKYMDVNEITRINENMEFKSKQENFKEEIKTSEEKKRIDNDIITIKPTTLASFVWKENELEGGSQDVIIRSEAPTMNTINNQFPKGAFNPVERKTIKRVLCMDSLFRRNPDTTLPNDISFKLPQAIEKVVSMSLVSLDIPNIWYTFSDKYNNNKFTIHTFHATGFPNMKHVVTIPPGNYMSNTLTTALNNYFGNAGGGLQFLHVEIDQVTGKTVFRAKTDPDSGEPTYPFDPTSIYYSPHFYYVLDFSNDDEDVENIDCDAINENYNTAGWMLGFRRIYYTVKNNDANTFEDYYSYQDNIVIYHCYLESESIYGDSVHDYLFFELDDFNNNFVSNTITSATREAYLGNNILARIPITTPHFQNEHNNKGDLIYKSREYFGPVSVEKMKVRLIDKYGNLINLHNNNFSFALEFTVMYG